MRQHFYKKNDQAGFVVSKQCCKLKYNKITLSISIQIWCSNRSICFGNVRSITGSFKIISNSFVINFDDDYDDDIVVDGGVDVVDYH
jgi:hypothetical protein